MLPGLRNADAVEHARELKPVLSSVHRLRRGAEDTSLLSVQIHGDVVRQLSSHRQDHTLRVLHIVDVHHHLQNIQLLKYQQKLIRLTKYLWEKTDSEDLQDKLPLWEDP